MVKPIVPSTERMSPEATVYRAFAERTFLEQNPEVGYDLPYDMFRRWWLEFFWNDALLSNVSVMEAGMSLHFMATMVEAGDA